MRRVVVLVLVWVGLAGLTGLLCGQHSEPLRQDQPHVQQQHPEQQQIERLIEQLGHPNFRKRQEASKALDILGKRAAPALRRASDDPNPEIAARARELLNQSLIGEVLVPSSSSILRSVYAGLLRIDDGADRVAGNVVELIRTPTWSPQTRYAVMELSQMFADSKGLDQRKIHSHLSTLMNDRRHGLAAMRRLIERARSNKGQQAHDLICRVVLQG